MYLDGNRIAGNSIASLTFAGVGWIAGLSLPAEGYRYMFACSKMPIRTFAGGSFTSVWFPACEDCWSIFPSETEMSVGLPSMASRVYDAITGKDCDQWKGYQV